MPPPVPCFYSIKWSSAHHSFAYSYQAGFEGHHFIQQDLRVVPHMNLPFLLFHCRPDKVLDIFTEQKERNLQFGIGNFPLWGWLIVFIKNLLGLLHRSVRRFLIVSIGVRVSIKIFVMLDLPRIGLVGSIEAAFYVQIQLNLLKEQLTQKNKSFLKFIRFDFQEDSLSFCESQRQFFISFKMQKYKLGNKLGDGSFGSVSKGINEQTGQIVAIKRMKRDYKDWNECINLNEVRIISKLHHPNIVQLLELIKKDNQLYFVFEFLNKNVYQLQQQKGKIPHLEVRNIIYQTLQALAYMHRKGFFHRDMKPENLLELNGTIKLADFGLARQIRAKPPFTQYVATRWYRAPQTLLRGRNYNSPMDIFAVGTIMAELYSGAPLFPGSSEKDQLVRILQVMGTPSKQQWPQGYRLAAQMSFQIPRFEAVNLANIIPQAPPEAISLIYSLLQISPSKRITAQQAIQHQYFQVRNSQRSEIKFMQTDHSNSQQLGWMKNPRYRPGNKCKL